MEDYSKADITRAKAMVDAVLVLLRDGPRQEPAIYYNMDILNKLEKADDALEEISEILDDLYYQN